MGATDPVATLRDTGWYTYGGRTYERLVSRHVPGHEEIVAELSCGSADGSWYWTVKLSDGNGGWLDPVRGWADTSASAQAAAEAAAGLPWT